MRFLASPLSSKIERFLQFKRAAGCRYHDEERELRALDNFLAKPLSPEDPVITEAIVRAYVLGGCGNGEHRLTLLRQFCLFVALEESRTFIPPRRFLGIHRKPFVPYVLTRNEGKMFLNACINFPPGRSSPLRGMVHGTALMLLYLTGMRVGEVVSLNLEDVDLENGVIKIINGKFGKSRFVPIAKDLTNRMMECKFFIIQSLGDRPHDACFFPGPKGNRCTKDVLRNSFHKVLTNSGIAYLGPGKGPRLHDLRHSYIILKMMLWYEQGADLSAMLPILSTYVGHVSLTSTQYYLRLTEDMLSGVLNSYEKRFGVLIQERREV